MKAEKFFVYPRLSSKADLWYFRIAGAGLGNGLIEYFYAYAHAKSIGARLLTPAWPSIRIGPMLRRERSYKTYIGFFRPADDEISGIRKILILARNFIMHRRFDDAVTIAPAKARTNGRLSVVTCGVHALRPLIPWREQIRARFLAIAVQDVVQQDGWGRGKFIAVHVRLGDFSVATTEDVLKGARNLRIPMEWYVAVVKKLSELFPELPIRIYSDGEREQLMPLLSIDRVVLQRESNDLAELASLTRATLVVGSRSTFSQLAVFLGNMPSIWFHSESGNERLVDDDVPWLSVFDDLTGISRENLAL